MSAGLAYTDWFWAGRGVVFIVIAIVSVVARLAGRGRRGVSGKMTNQQFHQPYPQQQYPQQQYPQQQYPQQPYPGQQYPQQPYPSAPLGQPAPPPPPPMHMPTSPFDGPRTDPSAAQADPFSDGPSGRPRSTPL